MIPVDFIVGVLRFAPYVNHIGLTLRLLAQRIAALYRSLCEICYRAAHPPKPDPTFTAMPLHPEQNTYSRTAKRTDWPDYLDVNWGEGDDSVALDAIAHRTEPLELVTPYHSAVIRGDSNAMLRLLARDLKKVDVKDYRGQTPAYWAAYFGNLLTLTILHNYGAKLDVADRRGKTPLRAAVKYGHKHVIAYLVSHGVDINRKDGRGLTPLQLAAYRGDAQTFETLVMLGADNQLQDANQKNPLEILENSCKKIYAERFFITRLFTSPTPSFSLRPYNINILSQARRQQVGTA